MNTRKNRRGTAQAGLLLTLFWLQTAGAVQPPPDVRVSVEWAQKGAASTTVPSIQMIPYPLVRKGRPLHAPVMATLKSLNARFPRILPYCTHPRLSIAELHPPNKDRTFWDFSLIDPSITDFLEATKGHASIIDFGPIPHWMFKGGDAVVYASDPDHVDWSKCGTGTPGKVELIDPSGQQVAEYSARIASWYTQGGFRDERGLYHHSGYHYELPWWGVLNEPNGEYPLTPEQYTRIYDAVVAAVRKVSPATKFQGMDLALAFPEQQFIEYFLDPHHHVPGTPLDMVSFHFSAVPAFGQAFDSWQYTVFDQLSGLINTMAYVDAIRARLSPTTRISIGELFLGIPQDWLGVLGREPVDTTDQTPKRYWNLAAAFYADAFIELSHVGVDVVTAPLLGYPPQMIPSVRMIDLTSGRSLPELQVLGLLIRHLGSSRIIVQTQVVQDVVLPWSGDVAAQAFQVEKERKLLLVNKRNRSIRVTIESAKRVVGIETVDDLGMRSETMRNKAAQEVLLSPFAVSILSLEE